MAGKTLASLLASFVVVCLSYQAGLAAPPAGDKPSVGVAPRVVPGDDLFAQPQVWRIRIEVSAGDLERLRNNPRADVLASVHEGEGDKTYAETAVHLKGRSGSFRSLDEKPALTLTFDKFSTGVRFHGHAKIHLNNSVEDPGYLNECLGAELFRAAGVPAPRVAHALVELNGRKLGLYVVKEAFTQEFLAQYFHRSDGSLYENDPGTEEPAAMRRNLGPKDGTDLKELSAVAQEPDPGKRWQRLQEILDLDRFFSFMAMELMTGHRDGYCLAANNFRIYHDPERDRFVFLPHGMDQLFGRADLPLRAHMAGPIARAVMETPPARRAYQERVGELFTNVLRAEFLTRHVDQWVAQLRPALAGELAGDVEQQAALLKERITLRVANLAKQLSQPQLKPMQFDQGLARLANWCAVDIPAQGKLEQTRTADGRLALWIRAGPVTGASWRTTVLLEGGRYRFEGLARTAGLRPLSFGKNKGAGLRVSGARLAAPHQLTGDSNWTALSVDFEVPTAESEIELLCEVRASQGEAWFDLNSLHLLRLQ